MKPDGCPAAPRATGAHPSRAQEAVAAEIEQEMANFTPADLANLKADLTWCLVAAMAAIGAILRFVG